MAEKGKEFDPSDCIANLEHLKFFKAFIARVQKVKREEMVHYKCVFSSKKKMYIKCMSEREVDNAYTTCNMTGMHFSPSAMLDLDKKTYVPVFNANFRVTNPYKIHAMFPHKNGLVGCVLTSQPYNEFLETFIRENGESGRYPTCGACSKVTNGRKKCARCRQMYCGRECQEAHWPLHKAFCRCHCA